MMDRQSDVMWGTYRQGFFSEFEELDGLDKTAGILSKMVRKAKRTVGKVKSLAGRGAPTAPLTGYRKGVTRWTSKGSKTMPGMKSRAVSQGQGRHRTMRHESRPHMGLPGERALRNLNVDKPHPITQRYVYRGGSPRVKNRSAIAQAKRYDWKRQTRPDGYSLQRGAGSIRTGYLPDRYRRTVMSERKKRKIDLQLSGKDGRPAMGKAFGKPLRPDPLDRGKQRRRFGSNEIRTPQYKSLQSGGHLSDRSGYKSRSALAHAKRWTTDPDRMRAMHAKGFKYPRGPRRYRDIVK